MLFLRKIKTSDQMKMCWEGILRPVSCKDGDEMLGRLIASCTEAGVMLKGDACQKFSNYTGIQWGLHRFNQNHLRHLIVSYLTIHQMSGEQQSQSLFKKAGIHQSSQYWVFNNSPERVVSPLWSTLRTYGRRQAINIRPQPRKLMAQSAVHSQCICSAACLGFSTGKTVVDGVKIVNDGGSARVCTHNMWGL